MSSSPWICSSGNKERQEETVATQKAFFLKYFTSAATD